MGECVLLHQGPQYGSDKAFPWTESEFLQYMQKLPTMASSSGMTAAGLLPWRPPTKMS